MVDVSTEEDYFPCIVSQDFIEHFCDSQDLFRFPVLSINYPVAHQELNSRTNHYQIILQPMFR